MRNLTVNHPVHGNIDIILGVSVPEAYKNIIKFYVGSDHYRKGRIVEMLKHIKNCDSIIFLINELEIGNTHYCNISITVDKDIDNKFSIRCSSKDDFSDGKKLEKYFLKNIGMEYFTSLYETYIETLKYNAIKYINDHYKTTITELIEETAENIIKLEILEEQLQEFLTTLEINNKMLKLYDPNDYYNTVHAQKCYLDTIDNVLNNITKKYDTYYGIEVKQSNGFYLCTIDNYNILTKYPQHYLLIPYSSNKIIIDNYTFKMHDMANKGAYILDNIQLMMCKLCN